VPGGERRRHGFVDPLLELQLGTPAGVRRAGNRSGVPVCHRRGRAGRAGSVAGSNRHEGSAGDAGGFAVAVREDALVRCQESPSLRTTSDRISQTHCPGGGYASARTALRRSTYGRRLRRGAPRPRPPGPSGGTTSADLSATRAARRLAGSWARGVLHEAECVPRQSAAQRSIWGRPWMPRVWESSPQWYASWVRRRCRIDARECTWRFSP
jgi:hypothetical protein